jgi:ligand-binding sensor domain-containing protein/signal transduction histidine kinase
MRFLGLLILLLTACTKPEKPAEVTGPMPAVVEARGRVVPADSVRPPVRVVVRGAKVVPVGKPKIVTVSPEGVLLVSPPRIAVGLPTVCVAGQGGYTLPKRMNVVPTVVVAGTPEKVLSRMPTAKDRNPKNITTFGLIHGLKHLNVSQVEQDRFGNLWIATGFGGVSRYDGKSFTTYTEREGLLSNTLSNIATDQQGNLWFSCSEGVSRFDGRTFTNYTITDWLPGNALNQVIADRRGNIWFATYKGIYRFHIERNELTYFTVEQGLPVNLVNRLYADSQGTIWMGTYEHGLASLSIHSTGGRESFTFRQYGPQQGIPGSDILSMTEGPDRTLWIGTTNGAIQFGLPTAGQGSWYRHFTTQNGLSNNEVNMILADRAGRILFGTDANISIYEAPRVGQLGRFTYLTQADGLPDKGALSLFEDTLGTLWIGTQGGLSAYRVSPFTFLTGEDGFTNQSVLAIMEDRHGTLWIGTWGDGLIQYRPPQPGRAGTLARYTTREGLSDNTVFALHEDRQGRIWVGTRYGGITQYTPALPGKSATFTHYTQQQGLLSDAVLSILEEPNGTLWFSQLSKTKGGVSRFDGQTFTNFAREQGLSGRDSWSMVQDKRGTFWIGSWGEGVAKYEPAADKSTGRFTRFDHRSGLSNDKVRPIHIDARGAIWFGTVGGGVCRYEEATHTKPARFTHFTEREGLSNNGVQSILEDRRGNLWFGNYYGISRFSPTDNRFTNFTQEDGFLGVGCWTNAICEDHTGKIWFGALQNLTILDPAKIRVDTTRPAVQLTDVRLFNEQTHWQTDTVFMLPNGIRVGDIRFSQRSDWYGIPDGLSLSHTTNFLTFSFVGINVNTPQTVRYQYWLEGVDKTWGSPTSRSEANYGSLSPGRYVFWVRAKNGVGAWSEPFRYTFEIRPPWWETSWAYVFYAVLVAGLVYALIQYRVAQGLARIRALEAIRTRISSDLHDDVGTLLSGLAMQSQMLALTAKTEQKGPLNEISDMSHEAMDRMRDTVWAIDSRKDKYENLIDRMRAVAEKTLNRKQITHTFDIAVEDARRFIDPQKRQHIYLIFKEAITNISKHSDARHVTIRFQQNKSGLYLLIHDDGAEKPPTNSDGLGLKNMQMRAGQLGGRLVISYANGFNVELIVG